ncbi:TIGR03086 family metal-binding protein [Rhodococcus sp. X156]|uniref:TIGR03086 family metal-binding protein n=1 Tax=Rhodococcus sp. X156 TaxID=2499145 RepID=UPI000FD93CD9|nr:TIGR03086 family metal-binding protein [Rhodococcus sp. X156]
MFDLAPATTALADLVRGVRDEQLSAQTPCADTSLAALLQHVDGLALAFTAAATKSPLAPGASQAELGPDWRVRIPQRLAALAHAWSDDEALAGVTEAGGQQMPGDVAAAVAANEVLVHGWDVAVASSQPFHSDPQLTAAALHFVASAVAEHPEGIPGLFGPPVSVPSSAPLLDQLIGLTGRDPAWRAAPVT